MTLDSDAARRLVRQSYDSLGDRYSTWAAQTGDYTRSHYLHLAELLIPDGSRVLDLGCGDGSLVTRQLSERTSVVGVDLSITQLRRAATALPKARFICADLADLSLPDQTFDAIVSFYCLNHLPHPDLPDVTARIARWLKPGGVFLGSFGSSDDAGTVELDWLGVPMYFSGMSATDNRTLIEATGLDVEYDQVDGTDEDGKTVYFHWIIARKPGNERDG